MQGTVPKRDHRIRFMVTETERHAIELLAAARHQTMSETLRTLARDAARAAGVWDEAERAAQAAHKQ
jgi:hypothetical protein